MQVVIEASALIYALLDGRPGALKVAEYWDASTELTLAEISLAEQLLVLARNVNDALRDAIASLNEFLNMDFNAVKQRSSKVRGYKNGAERIKDRIIEYLARLGLSLPLRDVYRQLALQLDRIAQNSDAIAYRLTVIASRGEKRFTSAFVTRLREMGDLVLREYETLLNSIRMLQENPRRSIDEARRVMLLEDEVDQRYRTLEVDVLEELKDDIIKLMIMREIIDLVEDTADVIKDAAENILFLALYKVTR